LVLYGIWRVLFTVWNGSTCPAHMNIAHLWACEGQARYPHGRLERVRRPLWHGGTMLWEPVPVGLYTFKSSERTATDASHKREVRALGLSNVYARMARWDIWDTFHANFCQEFHAQEWRDLTWKPASSYNLPASTLIPTILL
jgi:hypothetical protein